MITTPFIREYINPYKTVTIHIEVFYDSSSERDNFIYNKKYSYITIRSKNLIYEGFIRIITQNFKLCFSKRKDVKNDNDNIF